MYLFFDTETTGLSGASDRIVQIAWVLTDPVGNVLAEESHIIKPVGFSIPSVATAIHGITTERAIRDGRPAREVLLALEKAAPSTRCLVAHNMTFDLKFLRMEYENIQRPFPFPHIPMFCTMKQTTALCALPKLSGTPGAKWPKLQELHWHLFHRHFDGDHDALADAKACMRCFFELKRQELIETPAIDHKAETIKDGKFSVDPSTEVKLPNSTSTLIDSAKSATRVPATAPSDQPNLSGAENDSRILVDRLRRRDRRIDDLKSRDAFLKQEVADLRKQLKQAERLLKAAADTSLKNVQAKVKDKAIPKERKITFTEKKAIASNPRATPQQLHELLDDPACEDWNEKTDSYSAEWAQRDRLAVNVARNKAADEAVLHRCFNLAKDMCGEDEIALKNIVLLQLARNKKCPSQVLGWIYEDLDGSFENKNESIACALARNPSTPSTVLAEISFYSMPESDLNSMALSNRAHSPEIACQFWLGIVSKMYWDDRHSCAKRSDCPPEILKYLFESGEDHNGHVFRAIAKNENTPPDTLLSLAVCGNSDVEIAARNNPNCPLNNTKLFDALAKDPRDKVRRLVLLHPRCPPKFIAATYCKADGGISDCERLAKLSGASKISEDDAIQLIERKNCPRDVFEQFALSTSANVRMAVATSSRCPANILEGLANSTDEFDQRAVAQNPRCPPDLLRKLGSAEGTYVRLAVVSNPKCPADVICALANDSEAIVRAAAIKQKSVKSV